MSSHVTSVASNVTPVGMINFRFLSEFSFFYFAPRAIFVNHENMGDVFLI